jgi:diaminohydroxyphosphoribosylaminopyrimidine deaminase/5-amino-6-(5-phosphoribosylamino)uracil reductase
VEANAIRFMQRAMELACNGAALASPNPMVGCLIVREGEIVGVGFHQYDLRDHAEIIALRSAGEKARGATLYVNLEPCNHQGRTGPCTEAIIKAGVRRVVAAMDDPNRIVAGRGFARLREAGIEVFTGVEEERARRLNEAFACWIRTKIPFVTLKSALTLDGQIALPQPRKSKSPVWISSEESRAEVQRMRHESDAVMTGIGTVLADNPMLTDRTGLRRRRPLLRVVLDSRLRIPLKSRLVRAVNNDLLIVTAASLNSRKAQALRRAGVELIGMKQKQKGFDLHGVLKELGRREILTVLLEAGSQLNAASLASGIVDKLLLFYAPKIAGNNAAPFASGSRSAVLCLQNLNLRQSGPDFAIEAYLKDPYR